MNVHILATCRKPELAPFTELVFKTLRVGFPTASVTVYLNGDCETNCPNIVALCDQNKCSVSRVDTIHHKWIEQLVYSEDAPFFLCDTDVIFYSSIEQFTFQSHLAGFRVPEWQDEFSGAVTRARLHPSLLYIDPVAVRNKITEFRKVCPESEFTPFCNPFYPLCLPLNGRMYFHDTVSLLYHAIGGQEFTDEQKDAYFHFNFGTIPDLVLPRLKNPEQMTTARNAIMANPDMGRGGWRFQEEYYQQRQPVFDRGIELPSVRPVDAQEAIKWNYRLCNGDREAMVFNDAWYRYVHGIDDLIDTMQDGRPRMSREQILELFILAAEIYNCPFYVRHREKLHAVVILVTNDYANSVAWEKSPLPHRRVMGDVFRTCGDTMYDMVAALCGGWKHLRNTSPAIRERDWIGQHDDRGNPT